VFLFSHRLVPVSSHLVRRPSIFLLAFLFAVAPPVLFILPHACVKGKSKKQRKESNRKKRNVKKKEERERSPGRGRPQIPLTHVGTDSDLIAPSLHPTSTTHRDRLGHLPRSHSPPLIHAVPVFHIRISLSWYHILRFALLWREREYLLFTGIPLYFRKKCVS
jgi:hypothetical protein